MELRTLLSFLDQVDHLLCDFFPLIHHLAETCVSLGREPPIAPLPIHIAIDRVKQFEILFDDGMIDRSRIFEDLGIGAATNPASFVDQSSDMVEDPFKIGQRILGDLSSRGAHSSGGGALKLPSLGKIGHNTHRCFSSRLVLQVLQFFRVTRYTGKTLKKYFLEALLGM
jgi:hypothetical protein